MTSMCRLVFWCNSKLFSYFDKFHNLSVLLIGFWLLKWFDGNNVFDLNSMWRYQTLWLCNWGQIRWFWFYFGEQRYWSGATYFHRWSRYRFPNDVPSLRTFSVYQYHQNSLTKFPGQNLSLIYRYGNASLTQNTRSLRDLSYNNVANLLDVTSGTMLKECAFKVRVLYISDIKNCAKYIKSTDE